MKRAHRRWHWRIWIVLPLLLAALFVAALAVRPAPPGRTASGEARPQ
jgi:hypothetical protein